MKSPTSPKTALVKSDLEPNLIAYHCPESGGHYIPAASYWRWLGKNPSRLPQLPVSSDVLPNEEEPAGIRPCPETQAPMLRYQVGHGFTFTIDRSPTGGIWLDKGEWEALRSHNFHDELHLIFTLPWQRSVRQEASAQAVIDNLKNRIGEDSLTKVLEFKTWLEAEDEESAILAFLQHS
ncbi:MAG: hypothetical protein ACSHYB_09360 [Roseibacillus sp.]